MKAKAISRIDVIKQRIFQMEESNLQQRKLNLLQNSLSYNEIDVIFGRVFQDLEREN